MFAASRLTKDFAMALLAFECFMRPRARNSVLGLRRCLATTFLLSLVVFAKSAIAQSVNVGMRYHTWGLEDGLPDRVIQAIAQTPDGYLWLGTPHGLVRFDGFKFVPFGNETAPTLREFGISCILATKDGTLWIGSVGGGVSV